MSHAYQILWVITIFCFIVHGNIVFEFQKTGLVPEGIDYSTQHGFLVGSLGLGQIHIVDPETGNLSQLSSTSTLKSTLGIQVDEENNRIYVCNNNIAFPLNDEHASIVALRLNDGSFVAEYDLSNIGPNGSAKLLNDVTLPDANGNLYATDSNNGIIYRINLHSGDTSVFIESDALKPSDIFFSPIGIGANGIEIWNSEYLLVTRITNSTGSQPDVYKIDLDDDDNSVPNLEPVRFLDNNIIFPAFDGLYFNRRNGNLFAVAGIAVVYEFSTNDDWETAKTENLYPFEKPYITTCVLVDNSIFGLAANFFAPDVPYYIEQGDSRTVDFSNSYSSFSSSSNSSNEDDDESSSSIGSTIMFSSFIFLIILLFQF